jgi:branched-chain amino acid transport system substrate-binding protein
MTGRRSRSWSRLLVGAAPVLLCGLLVLPACGIHPVVPMEAFQETVDIGLVGTFSGSGGLAGDYLEHSLQVEADRLNAGGGLMGRRVEVIAADDEGNLDKSKLLVHQLATDPNVKLLVGPGSSAAFQATRAELAHGAVPDCVVSQISDDVLRGAPASFRTDASIAATVQALLGDLRRRRPEARRIGLIAQDGADGHFYDGRLADQASRAGLDYAGAEFVGDPNADLQPAVQDLVGKGVRAIVLSSDPALAGRTAQAVSLLGQSGRLQLVGPPALASSRYADAGGQAAIGTILASTIQTYQTDMQEARWPAVYRNFVTAITSRYGYAAGGTEMQGSAPAADCVVDWSAAVRRAGGFDGPQVIRAWETLDLPSSVTVLAAHERFTTTDHEALGSGALFIYQWQGTGRQRRLKQLAGP